MIGHYLSLTWNYFIIKFRKLLWNFKGSRDDATITAAQKVLMHRATSNKLAALGKYEGEEASGAAAESLFVANHSYWDYLTETLLYTYLLKHSQKVKM